MLPDVPRAKSTQGFGMTAKIRKTTASRAQPQNPLAKVSRMLAAAAKPSDRHRHQAELVHQPPVAVAARVRRGEQLRAVEDRVGAGEETQRLRLLAHVLAAGGE